MTNARFGSCADMNIWSGHAVFAAAAGHQALQTERLQWVDAVDKVGY
jgi:hypothetical protein